MKWRILLIFLVFSVVANSQESASYIHSPDIPVISTYSSSDIAEYIQENFKTAKEKLGAAYGWIISNIRYSQDSMYYRFWGEDPERKLSSVLKTRKGVCENFASLFSRIVNKLGIECYVVNGYTRINNNINWTGHSWCAVFIDHQWLLCDPTWDAGNGSTAHYFLKTSADFIENHMPFDPLWQLQEYPVSNRDYEEGYSASKKTNKIFVYPDSVKNFLMLDSLQQMEAISRRMKQNGLINDELRTWYAYNEMKIFIVYQEKDMNTFNSAVADLNKAKVLFNKFAQYRNNAVLPAKSDASFNPLFESIDSLLAAAYLKLQDIGTKIENFQYDTDGLKTNLDNLSAKVKDQKQQLKIFVSGHPQGTEKLLYK